MKLYLSEISDVGIPGGGGQTFVVSGATSSDDASGQQAVQEEIPPMIIDKLAHYGGVSKMAQQFMTGTGGEYRIMQEGAAGQEGEIFADQDTAVTALDLPNIGVQTFGAKTASSKPIVLTREMLQDAQIDIAGYAERQALRRMGRIWNKAFTNTQTGTGLPVGVVDFGTSRNHDRLELRRSHGLRSPISSTRSTAPIARWARKARVDSTPRWAA